ncbi:hypothetical protein LCGC14_2275630, partial [marine sediment metagenome]
MTLKFFIHNHQGKGSAYVQAMLSAGYEQLKNRA